MVPYHEVMHCLERQFDGLQLHHVNHANKTMADTLAKMGALQDSFPPDVFLEHLRMSSIILESDQEPDPRTGGLVAHECSLSAKVMVVIPAWTKPILAYLLRGELPEDKTKAWRIMRHSKAYTPIDGVLYKHSTTRVFQRCTSLDKG